MPSQLTKNVLRTIIYYDILDFPLTSFEIWKYLLNVENEKSGEMECNLGEIVEKLENEELKNQIEEHRGFYFLRGRQGLVSRRIQNDKNSIRKYRIARRATWWLRFVPYVRMVAVTGTVAMKNCDKSSDIDFFMVLENGRIFTGRLLATLFIHLLGIRRHGSKISDRICFNYFVTTESLTIKRRDLFAANEYSFLYPLFGFDVYENFAKANSGWMRKFKPNFAAEEIEPFRYVGHGAASGAWQKTLETLINSLGGDRMESWLRKLQTEKIERNPLTHKAGGHVEATDKNLVFLPEPQGPRVMEEFKVLTSEKYFL